MFVGVFFLNFCNFSYSSNSVGQFTYETVELTFRYSLTRWFCPQLIEMTHTTQQKQPHYNNMIICMYTYTYMHIYIYMHISEHSRTQTNSRGRHHAAALAAFRSWGSCNCSKKTEVGIGVGGGGGGLSECLFTFRMWSRQQFDKTDTTELKASK